MQSEKMQVQLCPQLASIQAQLKTAIANHQMVFGSYQKDPENAVLRDRLEEMQLQIKNLSNHQKVLVQQLRGELMQSACVATTGTTAATLSTTTTAAQSAGVALATSATPVVVTPSSMAALAKPLGSLTTRPQLLTLQPHANLGIVVPLAHVQAQPTLMTLPGVLNQPSLQTSQPLVSLQLSVSSATSPAAILTTPSPMNSASLSVSSTAPKQNQTSLAPSVAGAKVVQSVLRPIQPRPASPPIKVPHYTINHNHNTSSQGQNSGSVKAEKNGVIHRSFSDSDAKDLKKTLDLAGKDISKSADVRNHSAVRRKAEFMECLGLISHEVYKTIQSKRVERKRRSTANPQYCYMLDPDKRRNNSSGNNNWLMGGLPSKRQRGGRSYRPSVSPGNSRPGSPDNQEFTGLDGASMSEDKRDGCAECGKGGQLLLCGTCSLMYHLDCLSPPLASAPASPWSCPACIVSGKGNGTLSNGALSMVNSYITAKANKEDERRKLQRKNTDLLHEKQSLQEKAKNFKQQIEEKRIKCEQLTKETEETSASVKTLQDFVKCFQDPSPAATST